MCDPAEEYAARAGKLGRKDPQPWLELADFCQAHLLWSQREEALRTVVAIAPGHAEAHARLGEASYQGEWLPVEEAEVREAQESQARGLAFYGKTWLPEEEVGRLRAADSKAVGWEVHVRIDSPHLILYSALPLEFARHLAATLESEIALYHLLYGKRWDLDPSPAPIPVYLFADPQTYQASATAVTKRARPDLWPCMYNPWTRILYVGMTPAMSAKAFDPGYVTFLAVFEVIRALDDTQARCLSKSPRWSQIGRANYFGYALRGRQVLPGSVSQAPWNAASLLKEELGSMRVAQLMALKQAEFDGERVSQNYLWSWAWMHFLCHGEGGKHASRLLAFLGSPADKSSLAAFEKAVGPLAEMEPAFKAYLEKEFLPFLKPAPAE